MSSETPIEESGLDLFVRLKAPWLFLKLRDCSGLNEVLRGGVVKGEITELVGDIAAGKTQFCLSVIVDFLLDERDSENFVVFIDTNGSFRSTRLVEILVSNKISECRAVKLVSRVLVCRIFNEDDLKEILKEIQERKEAISLIVIDSIGSALAQTTVNYVEGGKEIQEEIIALLHSVLKKLGCAILTTNHFVYWKKYPAPSLGQKWLNAIDSQYLLAKLPDYWYIQLVHSRRFQLTNDRGFYKVTKKGIVEVKKEDFSKNDAQIVEEIISQNWTTVMDFYSQTFAINPE